MFLDLPIEVSNEQHNHIRCASHSSEYDGEWGKEWPRPTHALCHGYKARPWVCAWDGAGRTYQQV